MDRPICLVAPLQILLLGLALSPLTLAGNDVPASRYPAPAGVVHDTTANGALLAAGSNYKVHADGRGFTFVPFLGSDAPRNFPVRFSVDSVRTNGVVRQVGRDGTVSRDGDTIRIERQGVEAVYTLSESSVEQAFVVHEPGDLEVRVSLDVDSELQLEESAAGFAFGGAYGGVTYGAATAFSPDGRSCEVDAVPTARGLDLVVPASFAASCDGPLLIDPVIMSDVVSSPGASWTEVASDVGADEDIGYLVAIEREFSATDHDVFLYRLPVDPTTAVGTYVAVFDISTENWDQPSVAGRDSGNEFLVVARAGAAPSTRIAGRVVDADDWAQSAPFDLSSSSNANAPDVGSDRAGTFFLRPSWYVVWEEQPLAGNRNVRGRQVTEGAGLGPMTTFAGSPVDEFSPKLGETAGSSTDPADVRYTLAYRRASTTGYDLVVQQFDRSGTTVEGPNTIVTQLLLAGHDVSGPSESIVSNGKRAYLVVLENRALFGNDRDLSALVCGGAELLGTTSISDMSDEARDGRQMNPVVACDGDQWIVMYEELEEGASNTNVMMCSGDLAGDFFGLAERRSFVGDTPSNERHAAIASLWEGGLSTGGLRRAFGTWTVEFGDGLTGGAHINPFGGLICGVQYCEANPNSTTRRGWINVQGSTSPTATKLILCRDLPPHAATYVLVSREAAFVPNVGGSAGNLCLGGNGFGRFSNFVGPASQYGAYLVQINPQMIPQANGSVPAMSGETWYFQGWFRDFQFGQITSNLTNGVAVTFE